MCFVIQRDDVRPLPTFLTHDIGPFSDLIPFVHQQEVQKISKKIEVLVIFNGTTGIGEAMVILVCFVGDDC